MVLPSQKTFALQLVHGVAEYMRLHESWQLVVPGERGWPRKVDVKQWDGDGVILPVVTDGMVDWLHTSGIPFVNITARPGLPTVRPDNLAMGRMAAEHFLDQGFGCFGYVENPNTYYSQQRKEGFLSVLKPKGFNCHFYGEVRDFDVLCQWLESLPLPAGILCATDMSALPVYKACQSIGLHIPDQIALAGMDDEIVGLTLSPPLTSVQPDGLRVGFEAAAMLDRIFRGIRPPAEPVLIMPLGIAKRPSTAAFGFDDEIVVRAMRFIRGNAKRGMLVDRVVRECHVSRRNLERRFERVVGHSIWREMRRVQIEHVKNQLLGTSLPIKVIARDSAFPNPARLAEIFREETGETPAGFRKRNRPGFMKP